MALPHDRRMSNEGALARRPASLRLSLPSWEGWFLSGWAVLWAGLGAGARLGEPLPLTRLLLALLAGQVILGVIWATLSGLARRPSEQRTPARLALLPYSRPGSPAYRLSRWLARAAGVGGEDWLARWGPTYLALLTLAAALLALGWWLGPAALAASLLAVLSLPAAASRLDRRWGRAAVRLGWPWLLGWAAFAAWPGGDEARLLAWGVGLLAAPCLTLAYAGAAGLGGGWGLAALTAVLTPLEQPLATGGAGLLWLSSLIFRRRHIRLPLGTRGLVLAAAVALAGWALSRASLP